MMKFQHNSLFVLLLAIILLAFIQEGFSQSRDLTFKHITIEEGLSQSTVFAIVQDARGFMWFGTRDGLNRYDSRQIKTYFHNPENPSSISDNTIYSLFSDSQGRLWAGTGHGLNLYDPKSDGFQHFTFGDDKSSPSLDIVTCILEDRYKNLWIGTRGGFNLLKSGDTSFSFVRFISGADENHLINDDVRSLTEDSQGNIWIGTGNGLSRLTVGHQNVLSFKSYRLPDLNAPSAKNNGINSIVEDSRYGFLVATENTGLLSFDPETEAFRELNWMGGFNSGPDAVRVIIKNKLKDQYWIGTIGGLYIADPATQKSVAFRNVADDATSLTDNSVRSLYADRDGSIWIGTFHGGINIHSTLSRQFDHVEQSSQLRFKVASALMTDRHDNLWIGTEGSGLFFKDAQKGIVRHFRHLGNDPHSLSHNNVKCCK